MSIAGEPRPATIAAGGLDLLRPLSRLAALDRVWNLLMPASAAPDCRLGLELLGGGWLLLARGNAASLYSTAPFPPAMLRRLGLAPGLAWVPKPAALLGPVAAASAIMFAAEDAFGGVLTAEVSESLTR